MTKRLKNDNRGMTMAEVLLAFVILSIIMGLLSGIIAFSKKMYMQAADQRRAQEELQKQIYMKKFYEVKDYSGSIPVEYTDYLPVYRVDPVKDEEGNNTGVYDIALIKRSISGGKIVYSTSAKGFPQKAACTGSPTYNNVDSVTIGKRFAQINVSDWISDDEKEQLGDLADTNFILFNKIKN